MDEQIRRWADPARGVGFDQLLAIEPPRSAEADFHFAIYNADGSLAEQCGNGARCVAAWLARADEALKRPLRWSTLNGGFWTKPEGDGFAAELRAPDFSAAAVALVAPLDADWAHVSMGNPHALKWVEPVADAPLAELASALRASAAFAHGVNVGIAEWRSRHTIGLRVHERGAGETLACGSGACAAVAIGIAQGRLDSPVSVELPGGTLGVRWDGGDAPVILSGPTTFVFDGVMHD
jgi:diaminopimelate epimerase